MFNTVAELKEAFRQQGYIGEEEIITTVFLSLKLGKPLLIEGAPGVGKTEIAKVLARIFSTELVRLQCYEGLDEAKALYEWNYQKQLIAIQMAKEMGCAAPGADNLFSGEYLLERPLLKAIRSEQRVVLLIDEVDKTETEFEAFLFEVLSDFTVSIPELGTVVARTRPIVILTSNAERELSDGLKRRCAYLYIEYPSYDKELAIIRSRVPEAEEQLARQAAAVVQKLRELELSKKPSIAETLDWVRGLLALEAKEVTPRNLEQTLNLLLKHREDRELVREAGGCGGLCQRAGCGRRDK